GARGRGGASAPAASERGRSPDSVAGRGCLGRRLEGGQDRLIALEHGGPVSGLGEELEIDLVEDHRPGKLAAPVVPDLTYPLDLLRRQGSLLDVRRARA